MGIYFGYYIIVMSIIGFWSMWEDKRRAVKKRYRLSERTLFVIALIGGSIGSLIGMRICRHKTKHWYFKLGIPFILIVQVVVFWILLKPYLF
ncbi:DUF1294 domain-containing protein [Cellulosilyticum sp. I15G10I2]|uniref:DUF1294 domain-containing protein n=1 Tax=Cellulosilyticum sp. I15G10I2 TaxID=1892843 RepID=UPI002E8E08B1|nr:DUF1294 domain-containing protein [Cellulosilyticum sp. I15G10I2]